MLSASAHADVEVLGGGGPVDHEHGLVGGDALAFVDALPQATFHDLRRANASTLVAEGVDVKTAQTRLGHSDPRLTLAIYAQAVPKADRAAAKTLGRTFFRARRNDGQRGACDATTA